MVEADPVMRAARNGFGVLIVLLLVVGIYQFVFRPGSDLTVPILWGVGVAVFYLSQYHYGRQED